MIEIENIKMLDFIQLEDKSAYNFAADYSNRLNAPLDLFEFGELTKMSFGDVKDMQYTFSNGINWIELINFVNNYKGIDKKELVQIRFFDWCKFRAFIKQGLEYIETLEENLMYETSGDDEAAGIDSLNKYGVFAQVDSLAGGNPLNYEAVKKLEYSVCFTKLLYDKEKQDYINERNKRKRR
jgi:hypothetical protein